MNDREKLIELITEYHEAWKHGEGDWKNGLADHLLANGVTVLPCKVGQKVYTIPRTKIREWTVAGVWISADPDHSYALVHYEENENLSKSMTVDFKYIGKTVFLTREEAEKALAEREV